MSSSRIRSSSLTDYFVGARVRKRRTDLGLSAHQIGERINLSYQQVLNYERGVDRISAGRLYEIACALDTPITYFFEGFHDEKSRAPAARQGKHRQLDMARHLHEIHDEKHLGAISLVARALAGR
jgi:transcriptional regulator with XRE-family HTH domain